MTYFGVNYYLDGLHSYVAGDVFPIPTFVFPTLCICILISIISFIRFKNGYFYTMNNVDILVFGSHPDDIELSCGGTILSHSNMGYKIGLIDLTRGELGTRGTPEIRLKESKKSLLKI